MDPSPGSSRHPEASLKPEDRAPKTPVKRIRFADVAGGDTPRSVLVTPSSCTTACSNLSSLAATPLSTKMARMADRCIVLLDEYFAEQLPEPLSPAMQHDFCHGSDNMRTASSSTLKDDHSAKEFRRYLELPIEIQDKILVELLAVRPSHAQDALPNRSDQIAPPIAAVSKQVREQVLRIMERES